MNEEILAKFELDKKIAGIPPMEYMAQLLEANEKQEIEIERGKACVAILKEMNNRSRLLLDAAKKSQKFCKTNGTLAKYNNQTDKFTIK